MTHLPVLQGKVIIRALALLGYKESRQRGSHIRLDCPGRKSVTVPNHIVGRGLLRKILRDARITVEEFNELLK
ncbi:MAG: addiction module toxin, HicA family [Ignavibacteriales bacterium]|nr:addiction module toxin, HicA family [Ignavibacteriales bacterium]